MTIGWANDDAVIWSDIALLGHNELIWVSEGYPIIQMSIGDKKNRSMTYRQTSKIRPE